MRLPRLAALHRDQWQLLSAEQEHRAHPTSFPIPPALDRHELAYGVVADLLAEIATPDGPARTQTERLRVVVLTQIVNRYLGVLAHSPKTPDPGGYLEPGAEIPFDPEHVVAVAPGRGAAARLFPPTSHWARDPAHLPDLSRSAEPARRKRPPVWLGRSFFAVGRPGRTRVR